MKMVLKAIKEIGGAAFAREVLNYLDANEADRVDLKTFNAVNATLAYARKAGLLDASKAVYNEEKMLTKYAVNANTPSFEEEDTVEDAE
jgi:hypothetical protein